MLKTPVLLITCYLALALQHAEPGFSATVISCKSTPVESEKSVLASEIISSEI